MINPDARTMVSLANAVAMHPDILSWLREWKEAELSRLPRVVENTGIYQGRCQVLQELEKLLADARDHVAHRATKAHRLEQ